MDPVSMLISPIPYFDSASLRRVGVTPLTRRLCHATSIEVNLRAVSLPALHSELDDDIHNTPHERVNVLARESLPARALPHHQHQLLERQPAAAGVNAGDGSRMTALDVAQVIERLL